jgi:flagellar motor switch protein FliN/FliY
MEGGILGGLSSVRELLSLRAGAVVELEQAAGSPVDVLVNGTRIARGEVVVIDEEFGIRISEIVTGNGIHR